MHDAETTAAALVDLGRMSLAFGLVDRITFHQDGRTPESDTDHTVMLGLVACGVAARHFPDLDVGLVAQYALVHDLVEVYAGDTPTLRMPSADAKAAKAQREQAAYERILKEFADRLSWVPILIASYESRLTPESRFVKALDKLLPKITHLLNGAVTIRNEGVSVAELTERYELQIGEMRTYAADFPELFELREVLVGWVLAQLDDQGATTRTVEPAAEPLFITFKVTREGEQGHPMDHIVKRIEIGPDGAADEASIGRLVDSVRREIRRKGSPGEAP